MKNPILILILSLTACNFNKKEVSTSSNTAKIPTLTLNKTIDVKNALTFINEYVSHVNKLEPIDPKTYADSSSLTTQAFKTELSRILTEANKQDSIVGLDFDPIVNAQFTPEQGFKVEHVDTTSGYILLKGVDRPDFKLTMKLVFQNNKWQVDGCGIVNIPEEKRRTQGVR